MTLKAKAVIAAFYGNAPRLSYWVGCSSTFDFDKGVELADVMIDKEFQLNANDPNLKAFVARRGKLLMYHGWNDQLIAPQNSINDYRSGSVDAWRRIDVERIAPVVHGTRHGALQWRVASR